MFSIFKNNVLQTNKLKYLGNLENKQIIILALLPNTRESFLAISWGFLLELSQLTGETRDSLKQS